MSAEIDPLADIRRFEKVDTSIHKDAKEGSKAVAGAIADLVKQRQAEGKKVRDSAI